MTTLDSTLMPTTIDPNLLWPRCLSDSELRTEWERVDRSVSPISARMLAEELTRRGFGRG